MTKIFEAKVLAVGPEALSMIKDANMLILFGEEAPQIWQIIVIKLIIKI